MGNCMSVSIDLPSSEEFIITSLVIMWSDILEAQYLAHQIQLYTSRDNELLSHDPIEYD